MKHHLAHPYVRISIPSKTYDLHTLVMPMIKKARRLTAADKRQRAILIKKLTGQVYDENRPTLSVGDADEELMLFRAGFGEEAYEEVCRMAGRLPDGTFIDDSDDGKSESESAVSNNPKPSPPPPNLDALKGRAQQPQTTTKEREEMLDALRALQPRTTKERKEILDTILQIRRADPRHYTRREKERLTDVTAFVNFFSGWKTTQEDIDKYCGFQTRTSRDVRNNPRRQSLGVER
ncbi:hypothetical protein LTS15_000561 [Exophiala xenobiotica]|nr:hypothetical protein LTS15_000561 [Exophiala xenobiotica]